MDDGINKVKSYLSDLERDDKFELEKPRPNGFLDQFKQYVSSWTSKESSYRERYQVVGEFEAELEAKRRYAR